MVRLLSGEKSILEFCKDWYWGLFCFLIYINDLPDGITSICNFFADGTFPFSKILDVNESIKEINFDYLAINRLMKSHFLENQKSILIPLLL